MKLKPFIITGFLLVASYAGFLLARQINLLKKTAIKVVGYTLSGLLTNQASLNLVLQVTNNSDIDLMAKNGKFELYLNNVFVSNLRITVTKVLKANSTITIPVVAYFNPAIIVKQGIQTLLNNPNNISINIKGKISVVSSLIAVNNLKINETVLLSDILTNKK